MESASTQATTVHPLGSFLTYTGVGAASLLLANLGFLVLFVAHDLTLYQLVIIYWCECFWVGIFSVLKLLVASLIGDPFRNRYVQVSRGSSLLLSLFIVWFTSGFFFFLITLLGLLIFSPAFDAADTAVSMFGHLRSILAPALLLAAGHAVSFIANFLAQGEFRHARFGVLLALPFKRCLAMLGAVAVGLVFVAMLPGIASTTLFAVTLILFKLVADYRLHCAERNALRDIGR